MLLQMELFHCFYSWVTLHCIYVLPLCICKIYVDIFFIYSPIDGPWDCFHALGMVNSAAMNIGVSASFLIKCLQLFSQLMSNSLRPHGPQHARLPSPSLLLELAQIHVHYGARFFIHFPHVRAREALLSHRVAVFSSFLKESPSCFPQWPHQLTALPPVRERSLSSAFSPPTSIS